MNNKIFPCLWCNGDASLAAQFYTQVFSGKIIQNTFSVTNFELFGQKIMLLNAGPQFEKNASVSFAVMCESEDEAEKYWKLLCENGTVLTDIGASARDHLYGSVRDAFGITWQLYMGNKSNDQKIIPTLWFMNGNNGKAREAISFYTHVFSGSMAGDVVTYGGGNIPQSEEPFYNIKHASLKVSGYTLFCADSSKQHPFNFNEGISLVVMTEDQRETDDLWENLTAGGSENPCGWLKDRFGLSWQIIPRQMIELINSEEIGKAKKAVAAMLKMKKIVIKDLEAAAES